MVLEEQVRCTLRAGIFRRMALDMERVGHDFPSGHFSQGLPLRVMENEGAWAWGLRRIQDLVSSIWHVLPAAFRVFCFELVLGSQVQWRRQPDRDKPALRVASA